MTVFFFFNDTATTEIYTLSLHDALPIFRRVRRLGVAPDVEVTEPVRRAAARGLKPRVLVGGVVDDQVGDDVHPAVVRSEEHTSELQSRQYLVCRLLLEKKTSLSSPFSLT